MSLKLLLILQYGFIGLELVAMQLATPFGDGPNDIRVKALCEATVAGIERDLTIRPRMGAFTSASSIQHRRRMFASQKGGNIAMVDSGGSHDDAYSPYHSMHHDP